MSSDTLAPDIEKANFSRAINAFATSLDKDVVLFDVVTPVAHPMNQGVDGHSGKLGGANSKRLFLKVLNKDQLRWTNFEITVEMAKNAAYAGISPQLIASDKMSMAYLFECIDDDWRPATVLDLRNEQVSNSVLVAAKKLHGLALLNQKSISVFQRISELRQCMEKGIHHVGTGATIKVTPPEYYEQMCSVIDTIALGFAAAKTDITPCHVENSLSNFLIGPSRNITIVDFDRAANGDPLSDIGGLCNEYCRTDTDIAQAVEIYSGDSHGATLARVKLHMILSAFEWGLWGKVSHFSTNRPEIEYYKYGENQFMRCAYHMANWDVEQLIGEM